MRATARLIRLHAPVVPDHESASRAAFFGRVPHRAAQTNPFPHPHPPGFGSVQETLHV